MGIDTSNKTIWNMWEHKDCGNNISWTDLNKSINGHIGRKSDKVKNNDELHCMMSSGKIGIYKIFNVRYMSDPTDQFFADVEFIGYKGDKI